MNLNSKIELHKDAYENIAIISDLLIEKLYKNKLYKEDREMLAEAVALIYEIRANQY